MPRLPQVATVLFFSSVFAVVVLGQIRLQDSIAVAQELPMAKSPADKMLMVASTGKKNQLVDPVPFALIELFTSEGCSSCPSADRNLESIAKSASASGERIYTLSYHVDYWNYLGWSDPYSAKDFADRQREYARQFRSSRVYTPQMVVNGQAEFVGSNREMSERGITAALRSTSKTAIAVGALLDGAKVKVDWQAKGLESGSVVHVALVQNEGEQNVNRGENARRKLTHVNIVRHLKSVRKPGNSGQVELEMPDGFKKEGFHVVAFVQSRKAVIAAAKSEIGMNAEMSIMKKRIMKHGAIKDEAMKTSEGDILKVTLRKPAFSTAVSAKPQKPQKTLVESDKFLEMLNGDPWVLHENLDQAKKDWDLSYVPMLLEVGRFLPTVKKRRLVMALLESKTGNKFGLDINKWRQWIWKQKYKQHPQYAKFKSILYRNIDTRFAEYFADTENATIRLDEIRWGGVRRDGIPPLVRPKMLGANQADYLADTDVVFGVEINGDARAYPKRILAWHEMFKDTIGGESICGVY